MANYSPQHFEPRAKAVNVKGVANRAVATVLTAGLIAQPLMSPLAAIAAPSTDNGDSLQGGGRKDGCPAGRGGGKASQGRSGRLRWRPEEGRRGGPVSKAGAAAKESGLAGRDR